MIFIALYNKNYDESITELNLDSTFYILYIRTYKKYKTKVKNIYMLKFSFYVQHYFRSNDTVEKGNDQK